MRCSNDSIYAAREAEASRRIPCDNAVNQIGRHLNNNNNGAGYLPSMAYCVMSVPVVINVQRQARSAVAAATTAGAEQTSALRKEPHQCGQSNWMKLKYNNNGAGDWPGMACCDNSVPVIVNVQRRTRGAVAAATTASAE
jgi:hypothetical protein